MNFKALSVPCINSCILWFIGVIYHTILSVFHIGMNFHIIIRREPAVKFILCCRRPEHGSVQNTTVFKTVRQPADINATTLSEGFYRHLDFLVFLDQDLRIRQCKDILFALAEIYGSVCIFQNKMISVFFPVVFVCIEIKSSFFLYSQDIIQLKEFSLPISMSFRLFGALLSGLLVSELVYYTISLSFVLPVLVGVLFTILHALIQTYVLTMLTANYYGEVSEPPKKKAKKEKKPAGAVPAVN